MWSHFLYPPSPSHSEPIRPDCHIVFALHTSRNSPYTVLPEHAFDHLKSHQQIQPLHQHANTLSTESLHFSPDRTNFTFTMEFQINRIHQKEQDLPTGGNWVVQKFGGTSVGKFAVGIAQDIVL